MKTYISGDIVLTTLYGPVTEERMARETKEHARREDQLKPFTPESEIRRCFAA